MIRTIFLDRKPSHLLSVAALALAAFLAGPALHAQVSAGTHGTAPNEHALGGISFGTNGSNPEGTKDPNIRTLQGKVLNTDGKPVKGAIVYLKDKKDSSVLSMAVDDKGTYRFVQLGKYKDYEVWAQDDKKKGTLKTISQFDSRMEILMNLKVE